MSEEPLEQVFVAQGITEAEIIKGKLESFGIPVLLRYESTARVFGLNLTTLGEVGILVPAAQAGEARSLIESALPPDDEE